MFVKYEELAGVDDGKIFMTTILRAALVVQTQATRVVKYEMKSCHFLGSRIMAIHYLEKSGQVHVQA